jgi:predicted secreted protein
MTIDTRLHPMTRCGLPALATLFAAVLAGPAQAQTAVLQSAPQNVVSLTAQASQEVAQDTVAITLQVLREGSDAATVQSQLRQALDNALTEARKAVRPGQVDVRTGAFSLYPRYANKQGAAPTVAGWQGQAELVLEGRDIGAISQLAGRLPGLTVSRVLPGLSREARERVEGEVAGQAIAQFKARADGVARHFGFGGYSLREVTVGGSEVSPPPGQPMFRMAVRATADEAQPVAPGQTTVSVTVSGSVQLSAR